MQDELEHQSSQGSFTQVGRMDILATTIGKPDNPSRVRGESNTVTASKYFGRTSSSWKKNEVTQEFLSQLKTEFKDEVKDEVKAEVEANFEARFALLQDQMLSLLNSSQRGSNTEGGQVNKVFNHSLIFIHSIATIKEFLGNQTTKGNCVPVQISRLHDPPTNSSQHASSTEGGQVNHVCNHFLILIHYIAIINAFLGTQITKHNCVLFR